jgi:iron only hydrogenase large subunit-like protein
MNEMTVLIEALKRKDKLVAMLAPSFPIVFEYPHIITKLKNLGFSYVIEVSAGAKKTNEELLELLKQNPEARYITSPCPTVVRMIKKQMPQYAKYFTHNVDSPMVATAKIAREHYPDYRPVFIGPCIVKKMEAIEDVPDLNILVLTYDEINQVFTQFNTPDDFNSNDKFDISEPGMTRIYPVDGGLSHSSGLEKHFNKEEIQIVSGWKNCMEAVKNFDTNPKVRLLDILFCEGGCIGGPGIKSNLTSQERKQKVLDYAQQAV